MNRRKLFSLLPLSLLGLAAGAKAEPTDPSIWVEMTCQHEAHYEWKQGINGEWIQGAMTHPACGQKFKVLRVAITPYCPKCGRAQDISRPGIREQFQGQPC